jgi:hypothetical protein
VHETAHTKKVCRWCGESKSVRGMPRHEASCRKKEADGGNIEALFPTEAWQRRATDFCLRASEIPDHALLVMCEDRDPLICARRTAAVMMADADCPCVSMPTRLLPDELKDKAPPRDRRKPTTATSRANLRLVEDLYDEDDWSEE